MALFLAFVSCSTTPPATGTSDTGAGTDEVIASTEPSMDGVDQGTESASSTGETGFDTTTNPESVAPATVEAPPAPITLQLINPSDPGVVGRQSFLFSALPSDGTLATITIEVLKGPVAPDPNAPFELVDFSTLSEDARTHELRIVEDPMLVQLPRGLVDGASYDVRVRGATADGRVTEWLDVTTRLSLQVTRPVVSVPPPTIDTTPSLSITADSATQITVDARRAFQVKGSGTWAVPFELDAGTHTVRAWSVDANGIVSMASDPVTIRILADATGRPTWPIAGERTFSARTGLHWSPVEGAVAYQARYRVRDADAWQNLNPTVDTFSRIPTALDQTVYEWQVRAQNEAGNWFSWSDVEQFDVGDFAVPFAPIIRSGQSATFTRGSAEGSRDEQPVRDITLRVPYEMAVSPISNGALVRIISYASARGFVSVDESGVYTADDRREPLVGIGSMEYGQQFGLTVREGTVSVVPGYETHPAIGVTWLGAVEIANFLSFVEGRSPVYDELGAIVSGQADGYRLPTEAEWEYAARGTTDRSLPWDGSLSGRVSNYYRSFDPFEDVNEPFTSKGGPTTPVRFFDGAVHGGFQTASDASPFGIRDMVGNVWEWCFDRYDPGYYAQSPDTDPTGPEASDFETDGQAVVLAVALDPNQRVVRGAAWNSREPDVRLTNRGRFSAGGRSYSIGVRLVRAPLE